MTGFSVAEIDKIIGTAETGRTRRGDGDDAPPDVPATAPVTRPGVVWQLDDHRLVCADARDEASYAVLMTAAARVDDKRNDAIVIIVQRLHVDNLAGHVLGRGDWTHLDLAAIAAADAAVPIGRGRVQHRKKGDLLHLERQPQSALDEIRPSMGSAAFSAQHRQRPVSADGNMVQWNWFRRYAQLSDKTDNRTKIVQSWIRRRRRANSTTIRSASPPWRAGTKSISSTWSAPVLTIRS